LKTTTTYIIVGNLYRACERHEIFAFDSFIEKSGSLPPGAGVVLGQGLSFEETRIISAVCRAARLQLLNAPLACCMSGTHKFQTQNIVLGPAAQVDTCTDSYELRVDSRNELLLDHVTGQHLSAMIGVEAARQAGMATFERRYLAGKEAEYAFSLSSLEQNFSAFIFPLPAQVICSIDVNETRRNRWQYKSRVIIKQGRSEWTASHHFTVAPKVLIRAAEESGFAEAIRQLTSHEQ
jgi:hypothetical protein